LFFPRDVEMRSAYDILFLYSNWGVCWPIACYNTF
jgi:hypothetical protein